MLATGRASGRGVACQGGRDRWDAQRVTCPQGATSVTWVPTHDPDGNADIVVSFHPATCRACPCRAQCTRSVRGPRRLMLHPPDRHLALQATRARQRAPDFPARYAARAGVEGTIAQGVSVCDLRHARYRGLAKTIPPECPARDGGTVARNDHRH